MKRVCVVGGGIAGLAAAWRLQECMPGAEMTILEAGDRPGGKIRTIRSDGCVLESGAWWLDAATMLPLSRWLRRELDLDDQVLPAGGLDSFIWHDGSLHPRNMSPPFPFPLAPQAIATSGLLSVEGVARAAAERTVPPGENDSESVADFFERRLGPEYVAMLLSPWFQSVFMARPSEFSMLSLFPQLIEIERRFKSLTKAHDKAVRLGRFIPIPALAQMQPTKVLKSWLARDPLTRQGSPRFALRYGLSEIVEVLSGRLGHAITLNEAAERLVKTDRGWLVITPHRRLYCDTAVLAAPAHATGRLLAAEFPEVASRLAATKCTSGAVVNLVYAQPVTLAGKEILTPLEEGGVLRSVQCVSDRFAEWADGGRTIIRAVLGPMSTPLPSADQILADCLSEIQAKFEIEAAPVSSHVEPFPHAYPIYGKTHPSLVAEVRRAASPGSGLCVLGGGLIPGGIPAVIQDAFEQIDAHAAAHF